MHNLTKILPRPLVLNGPSGCGKSTLVKILMKENPNRFSFSVSHTTRKPRKGEKDGIHYHYISKEEFEQDLLDQKFIETAEVHGNYYGTSIKSIQEVQEKMLIPILDLNIDGAVSIKQIDYLNPHLVFITTPSLKELERRLRGRGTETEEQIQTRLKTTRDELDWVKTHPNFYHHIIVNDDLKVASKQLFDVVKKELANLK
ncbi:guanylate kinase-related [Anaeramoeba flamelloides]|uniref:guanylate kinase n=1 Tax=Anaeramoeba flamelloides TaxID=1746091 RepID=A0AAV7ZRT9_9EUKA|nr:guanylate kinase-related [Anaeramoeba flamelloides]KAJ6249694.1 guanylate kinase-related [Anaeramoeba flamelloides]